MFRPRNVNHLAALIGVPLLMLGVVSARAADLGNDAITVSGNYDDATRDVAISHLNLALPADQHTLRHRLSLAARHVCLDVAGNSGIESDSVLACYRDSMSDAWATAQGKILVASTKAQSVVASRQPRSVQFHDVMASLHN